MLWKPRHLLNFGRKPRSSGTEILIRSPVVIFPIERLGIAMEHDLITCLRLILSVFYCWLWFIFWLEGPKHLFFFFSFKFVEWGITNLEYSLSLAQTITKSLKWPILICCTNLLQLLAHIHHLIFGLLFAWCGHWWDRDWDWEEVAKGRRIEDRRH